MDDTVTAGTIDPSCTSRNVWREEGNVLKIPLQVMYCLLNPIPDSASLTLVARMDSTMRVKFAL